MSTAAKAARDDWNSLWRSYAGSAEENPAQRYRRELVFSFLELDHARGGARVLDVGSGQGDFAAALVGRFPGVDVLGLELSEAGVAIAAEKVRAARFVQRDLLEPGEPPPALRGWATHAVCSEVLEHLDDPRPFLENLAAYLAPGCRLVVTVPGGPMSAFDRHIGHRRHFRPADVRAMLAASGFAVETVGGAGFPFFNLYRMVVLLRGRRLIADVAGTNGASSPLARAVMRGFGVAFALNLRASPWGWQIVATARAPG
jgi:SAM-dependent methyltransferase